MLTNSNHADKNEKKKVSIHSAYMEINLLHEILWYSKRHMESEVSTIFFKPSLPLITELSFQRLQESFYSDSLVLQPWAQQALSDEQWLTD